MKILIIALGVLAFVPTMLAIGVLVAMWRAWWLHPLWALLIVPLGVPLIGFWHFMALGMFLHAWRVQGDSVNDKKQEWSQIIAPWVMAMLWPVITYYFVRWYLGVL